MSEEYWWSAYGVLLRKFSSLSEGSDALDRETDPVVLITGEGWNIEVKKSDITVISRQIKNLLI
jgi:hypothetical protein